MNRRAEGSRPRKVRSSASARARAAASPGILRRRLFRKNPANREEAPVRSDRRAVLELLERTHPPHGPAPHGHRRREDRVRLLEAERPLEVDLRFVVAVEDHEGARAVERESARAESLGSAAHGFLARHLEVDRRLGERAREPRVKDRRAGEDREQAENDEDAIAPVEAARAARRDGSAHRPQPVPPPATARAGRGRKTGQEPGLEELGPRSRAALHAAVDRFEAHERAP